MTKDLQPELDAQRQKVDVDHFDIPVRELVRMVESGELVIAPEYQRNYRWDERRASELVESLLLGLPVPPIFVATNEDSTWELVDGLQRIGSLLYFISTESRLLKMVHRNDNLTLEGLQKLRSFNGETFATLPASIQIALGRRPLRVTALSDKSVKEVRFDLFERLNRGGITLSQQEVRACIYRGPLIQTIEQLAKNENFHGMLKLQPSHTSDGTREEQILKFFAYLLDRSKFDGKVRDFLNKFAEDHQSCPDREAWIELFTKTVDALFSIFPGPVKRRGYGNTPLNQFEAIMVAAAELIQEGREVHCDAETLMQDEELVGASTKGTNSMAALTRRIDRAKAILGG